jgi:hypothetical protein
MFYELLGRIVWTVLRGYFRQQFPHARRNLAIAGVAGVAVGVGIGVVSRRGSGGGATAGRGGQGNRSVWQPRG